MRTLTQWLVVVTLLTSLSSLARADEPIPVAPPTTQPPPEGTAPPVPLEPLAEDVEPILTPAPPSVVAPPIATPAPRSSWGKTRKTLGVTLIVVSQFVQVSGALMMFVGIIQGFGTNANQGDALAVSGLTLNILGNSTEVLGYVWNGQKDNTSGARVAMTSRGPQLHF